MSHLAFYIESTNEKKQSSAVFSWMTFPCSLSIVTYSRTSLWCRISHFLSGKCLVVRTYVRKASSCSNEAQWQYTVSGMCLSADKAHSYFVSPQDKTYVLYKMLWPFSVEGNSAVSNSKICLTLLLHVCIDAHACHFLHPPCLQKLNNFDQKMFPQQFREGLKSGFGAGPACTCLHIMQD